MAVSPGMRASSPLRGIYKALNTNKLNIDSAIRRKTTLYVHIPALQLHLPQHNHSIVAGCLEQSRFLQPRHKVEA
jgi:hypothetical protein